MAEIRLSTAGIKMYYAVESTAGTRPTALSAYTEIPEITEIPEFSSEPETIDVTPLSATKYRIKIPGLIDLGDVMSFTANFSQTELEFWNETLIGAYEAGIAADKATWFCIVIPDFDDAFYFTGQPTSISFPNATVGSGLTVSLPLTPTNEPAWYPAPTSGALGGT